VRRKGWWPCYRADITEWVRSCHHCQLVKPGPGKGKQRLKQERVGAPRERVAIDRTTTTPYSPQSNEQVERVNQTLQNMLKCIFSDTGKDWEEAAQWAAAAYRACQQESTGQSLNKLTFGEEVAQPLDVVYGKSHEVTMCATEYAQWLLTTIAYVHAQARKHLNIKLKAQKIYYDRKLRERSFEVGEQVLWLRVNVAKLENVWQGPYVVVNKQEEWYYYTLERDGKRRRTTAPHWIEHSIRPDER
jgi:hypothetical protein